MSRPLRIQAAGLTYHVTARGNGRMVIFRDDIDRSRFLEVLATVVEEKGLVCHSYCEMYTHVHLLVTTMQPNISSAIKSLNGDYAQWWNHRHGHVGHVFQGRFHAQIVQDDSYLLTAANYIVRNPMRGRLVESPEQWEWSSYRATAGLGPVPAFLSPQLIWEYMGGGSQAPLRYREFVNAAPAQKLSRLPILGDDQFVQRFSTWRTNAGREVPARDRVVRPPLEDLCVDVTTRPGRDRAVLLARSAGYRVAEIARQLGVHESTVRRVTLPVTPHPGGRMRGIQT
jgi:putative transposase